MLFGLLKPSEKKCSLEVNIAEATVLVTRLAGKLVLSEKKPMLFHETFWFYQEVKRRFGFDLGCC